jgi:hypothetical protein
MGSGGAGRTSVMGSCSTSKGEKGLFVSLNENAVVLIRHQRFRQPTHVFTCNGEPVKQPNHRAFRHAVKRTGIDDFHCMICGTGAQLAMFKTAPLCRCFKSWVVWFQLKWCCVTLILRTNISQAMSKMVQRSDRNQKPSQLRNSYVGKMKKGRIAATL